MNRKDLRAKGIDIVIHPVIVGLDEDKPQKFYSFSIFDNEEEVGDMHENPDFDTYELAEAYAVEEAITWIQTQQN